MADMMVDATLFLDYRAGDPGARAMVESIFDGRRTASVSPATLFQLWAMGLDRRTEIGYTAMLDFLEIAPLSAEAAKAAGVLAASADHERRDPATVAAAALVAATARERGEPVCTRDADLFSLYQAETIEY